MKKLKRHPESRSLLFKVSIAVSALLVATGGVIAWLAFFTDVCSISNVVIRGNKNLSAESVRKSSGVEGYKNLITVPVRKIQQNLEKDPWVRKAKIGRKLMHTIFIDVTERRPIAVVDCRGPTFIVDDSGHVVSSTQIEQYGSLPRIDAVFMSVPAIDEDLEDEKVLECIRVMNEMPDDFRGTLRLLCPFDNRGLVLVSNSNCEIIYGTTGDSKKKSEILRAICIDINTNARRVSYIDLRVPDSPVIR